MDTKNRIELDETLFHRLVDSLHDSIFIHAEDGEILYVNKRMLEMHGLPDFETVKSMNVPEHFSAYPDAGIRMREVVDIMWKNGQHVFEWVSRSYPGGQPMDVEIMLHTLHDSRGRRFFFAQARDISERKTAERLLREQRDRAEKSLKLLRKTQKELKRQALTDPLTGLYNRRCFIDAICKQFSAFQRYEHIFSLIIFDIDHFKVINDTYGHLIGDTVIKAVATSMSAARKVDMLARLGGDEFAVLLPETTLEAAEIVAKRLLSAIQNLAVKTPTDKTIGITISAGVAAILSNDQSHEMIIQRADEAMYRAKRDGKNTCSVQAVQTNAHTQPTSVYEPC